ncbi:MAG: hypothetical protein ABW164_02360 [Sphingobium sp.]
MLLLALLTMGHMTQQPRDERELVTFDVKPQGEEKKEEEATKRSEKREEQEAAPPERAEPVVRRPPLPVPTRNPVPDPPPPLPFLTITRDEMASADIGKMPGKEKAGTEKAGTGEGSKVAAAGPGEGPGGVQLYDAEWYRRPTHAELSPYVPASAPPRGYGLVACQTIERYHVENCQILSESPPGSGLARAIRLAAWQFLVLPPRVNGKVMVGSWVRIRIDYNRVPASSASEGQEGG